ncbi:MAG TPA: 30S ribosomal protein S4 [Thermoplasmata archaeon]|jgi:small subunit ribosomal protein S4|nr:30S ribosomal protein S4 [Thermoplasmata archaeon]
MGDPKFSRRTYDTPKHPWEAARMDEERKLLQKYGLKNKRELWKAQSILRGFRGQARDLQARLRLGEPQARRETDQLIGRLTRLGLLPVGSPTIDDVLALTTEDLLQRRFEWIVFQRGLAPTANGARQWITHGHFSIGDHRVTRPGYLVPSAEEPIIAYSPTSPLANEDHALRVALRERQQAHAAPAPAATPEPAEES